MDNVVSSKEVIPIPFSPEKIASLENYIYSGGQLIKQGNYDKAIEHFKKEEELCKIGWRMGYAKNVFITKLPTPDEYGKIADMVARLSMNYPSSKYVELSQVIYYTKGKDGTLIKLPIPDILSLEIALVHMEEWLHVLQEIQGRPLAGFQDSEIDIAAYMEKNSIPMTNAFKRRYGREEALEKAKRSKK